MFSYQSEQTAGGKAAAGSIDLSIKGNWVLWPTDFGIPGRAAMLSRSFAK
jgi:hypothetical protein